MPGAAMPAAPVPGTRITAPMGSYLSTQSSSMALLALMTTMVYTSEVMSGAESFSDTAVIVIGRTGGENADLPSDMNAVINGTYDVAKTDAVEGRRCWRSRCRCTRGWWRPSRTRSGSWCPSPAAAGRCSSPAPCPRRRSIINLLTPVFVKMGASAADVGNYIRSVSGYIYAILAALLVMVIVMHSVRGAAE